LLLTLSEFCATLTSSGRDAGADVMASGGQRMESSQRQCDDVEFKGALSVAAVGGKESDFEGFEA
jgi:hypothetical protein